MLAGTRPDSSPSESAHCADVKLTTAPNDNHVAPSASIVNEVDGSRAINYRRGKKPKTEGASKEGGIMRPRKRERGTSKRRGKKSRLAASGGKLSGTTDGGGGIGGGVRGNSAQCVAELSSEFDPIGC